MPLDQAPYTPDEIRAVRADRSVSEFARLLGVRPLTVTRWELPEAATESRRPRRGSREKLRALAQIVAPAPALGSSVVEAPGPVLGLPGPALKAALAGRWEQSRQRALEALSAAEPLGVAEAQVALALEALLARGDSEAALTGTLGLLAGPAGPAQAWAQAVAALASSAPCGRTFSPQRVSLHASQVMAAGPGPAQELACIAQARSALHGGRAAGLSAALRHVPAAGASPVTTLLRQEMAAWEARLRGRSAEASRIVGALAMSAPAGLPLLRARALALQGLLLLEQAEEPTRSLALAGRASDVLDRARVSPGHAHVVVWAVEAEARFRRGETDEAAAALARGADAADAAGWPALALIPTWTREAFHHHGLQGYVQVRDRLLGNMDGLPAPLRAALEPYLEALILGAKGELLAAAEQHAVAAESLQRLGTLPEIEGLARMLEAGNQVISGEIGAGREALRRGRVCLERHPSVWIQAWLMAGEGVWLAWQGRAHEAMALLEAAEGTFRLAGDVGEAARARRSAALASRLLGTPDAAERMARTETELAGLGIAVTPAQEERWLDAAIARRAADKAGTAQPDRLAGAVRRLSVRGLSSAQLLRELVDMVADLAGPDVAVTLSEDAPLSGGGAAGDGASAPVGGGSGPRVLSRRGVGPVTELAELADGSGRRLRLSMATGCSAEVRAHATLLCCVAELALEVSTLRTQPVPDEADDGLPTVPGFVAASSVMHTLLADVARVARTTSTVLVTGESGTGKELVAQAIHQLSPRAAQPWVVFNCATVPAHLFDAQLFGYRKGAFTGASRDHPGMFRAADGGTLFLDEVGELPADVQARLLRFLENGEVLPLGEVRPVRVDVRVVAATHRDLAAMVQAGLFREDLYYRLQVVPLHVPPLRERPDDIVPLAAFLIKGMAGSRRTPRLTSSAAERLRQHVWPGNVRELRNVLERALALLPDGAALDAAALRLP
jgi:tetratricopeptide (TPR) repeat protein